jgi:hypothetical protein
MVIWQSGGDFDARFFGQLFRSRQGPQGPWLTAAKGQTQSTGLLGTLPSMWCLSTEQSVNTRQHLDNATSGPPRGYRGCDLKNINCINAVLRRTVCSCQPQGPQSPLLRRCAQWTFYWASRRYREIAPPLPLLSANLPRAVRSAPPHLSPMSVSRVPQRSKLDKTNGRPGDEGYETL